MSGARKKETARLSTQDSAKKLQVQDKPLMAYRRRSAVIVFLAVAIIGLTSDLLSKHFVFKSLLQDNPAAHEFGRARSDLADAHDTDQIVPRPDYPSRRDIGCGLRFSLSTNRGVVFGIYVPPAIVAIVSFLTVALVVFFFATGDARLWTMHIGLAMILSGALGNLYDRMLGSVNVPGFKPITNQVRDFIDLSAIRLPFHVKWPWSEGPGLDNYPYIFNVADVLLVVGVGLLIANWFLHRRIAKQDAMAKKQ